MSLSLQLIEQKQMTIGVIGLGYVGLPLSLAFAEAGVKTIGFDIDEKKVTLLNQGASYLQAISSGRLQQVSPDFFVATSNWEKVSECLALLICVPTPLDAHLQPDLSFIKNTAIAIAPHLQAGSLVCLESTTWPGTTEEILVPILEKESGLKGGKNLWVAFSPERQDPGSHYSTEQIPKLVGGVDAHSLALAVKLYQLAIDTVIPVSSVKIAESAKLVENIFRSVNIALVNELKMIFTAMDIDVWQVLEAAATKPFGFMPFWPGPGLGGHCVPIDPFYLSWKAKEFAMPARFIELAGEINRDMPKWVVAKVQECLNFRGKALFKARLLILGLAYKADIDDFRESPSLKLIELLEEKGAQVAYHDPLIPQIGPCRQFASLSGRQSAPLSSNYDCLILATKHSSFCAEEILQLGVPIVDTRAFFPNHPLVMRA